MPNFLKKASKRTHEVCVEDETAIAALFIRPSDGGDTKRLGAPGGALGKMAPLADQVSDTQDDERGALFAQNAVLILTDHRLLVFGHGSLTGRVRELIGEIDLADVASLSLEPTEEDGALGLAIEFDDGTIVNVAPGSRRQRFIDAFNAAKQPAGRP